MSLGVAKQKRSLDRIDKILDSAHDFLEDNMPDDISIAKISNLAQLKRTSTYKFFPHPDNIKEALCARYFEECLISLEKSEINNGQIYDCIKMMLSEFYNYFKNNIAAQKIVFHNNFSPTFNNEQLKEIGNVILKKIEAVNSLPQMFNKEGVFLVIVNIVLSIFSLNIKENKELNEIGLNEAIRASYAYYLSCATK